MRIFLSLFCFLFFCQRQDIKTRNGDLTNLTLESEVICNEAIQRIQSNFTLDCPLPPIVLVSKTRIKKESQTTKTQ
jgi:hypothetical protein